MKTRAITGFFFVLIMLSAVLFDAYAFTFFFVLLGLLCLEEFYRLIHAQGILVNKKLGILVALAFFIPVVLIQLKGATPRILMVAIPFISLTYIQELYKKQKQPFQKLAYLYLGIIYAVCPFMCYYALGFLDGSYNAHYPLAFLLFLWASDTGAYLVGMAIGKHKLFERHSPKKTWEGFFGGMVVSILVSLLVGHYFVELSLWKWVVTAVLVVVFGTWGDLTESMLKRSFDVKDSGTLLPGHGGLLDRFDGLLLAAPLVYLFLTWIH